jgi:hypothetical protein
MQRVPNRVLAALAVVVLALLVADQARIISSFSRYWANEDDTILWYAARELGRWHLHQPNFYGQTYGTVFAAVGIVATRAFAVRPNAGLMMGIAAFMVGGWIVLAGGAWIRGHRLLGLLALALPVVLSNEYASWLPIQSRAPGSFVACLGAALLVAWPDRRRAQLVAWVLLGLGLVFDSGSIFVVVPVGAYALLRPGRLRDHLLTAAAGLVPAIAWTAATGLFYVAHPDYALHPSPGLFPAVDSAIINFTHLDRYGAFLTLELLRPWPLPFIAVVSLAGVLVATRRRVFVVPALLAAALVLVSLTTPKAEDGQPTVYLAYGRLLYSLAPLAWFLGVLVAESGVARRLPRFAPLAAGLAITLLVFGTYAARSATFDQRFDEIRRVARSGVSPVSNVDELQRGCRAIADVMQQERAGLVVMRYDRNAAYGCAADGAVELDTLFPAYERRTWRLGEESRQSRSRFLVTEVDSAWCASVDRRYSCRLSRAVPGLAIIDIPPQPVVPLLEGIGLDVRRFDVPRVR